MKQKDYNKRLMNAIKSLRQKSGMKQFELALALGKDQSKYSCMETGKKKVTPAQLRIMAKKLNTNVGTFFDMADEGTNIDEL